MHYITFGSLTSELTTRPKTKSPSFINHIHLLGQLDLFLEKSPETFPAQALRWLRCGMIDDAGNTYRFFVQIRSHINRFILVIRDLLRTNFGVSFFFVSIFHIGRLSVIALACQFFM